MLAGKIEVSSSGLVKRVISSSTGMRAIPKKAIDWSLKQRNVRVNVVMEFDNIETIKQAIAIDAGVSILPRPAVLNEMGIGSLAAVPLGIPDLVRPVGIIYRKQKRLSPTVARFIESLRKVGDGAVD
jgi:DNA-binding transcriptional LysR family regulator